MRWTLKPKPESSKVEALQKALQVEPIVATLLLEREIETFEEAIKTETEKITQKTEGIKQQTQKRKRWRLSKNLKC